MSHFFFLDRNDFLYGTYRARLKTSNIAGTVAAFFFYRNDTCEIDIETLSRYTDPYKTYFAVHPQVYNPDGSASDTTNEKYDLQFNPTQVKRYTVGEKEGESYCN